MEKFDYLVAWFVYLLAAIPFCVMAWRFFKRTFWREIAYFFQSFLLAITFTPWYVLADQEIMAPAMIIFMMDSITIGSIDGIRALIPLVMALLLGLIVTVVLSIVYRVKKKKQKKLLAKEQAKQKIDKKPRRRASVI